MKLAISQQKHLSNDRFPDFFLVPCFGILETFSGWAFSTTRPFQTPDHQALVGAQLFGNQTRFLNDISDTRITFLRLNQDLLEAKR